MTALRIASIEDEELQAVPSRRTIGRLLRFLAGVLHVLVLAAFLAVGAVAVQAVGAPSAVDAACNGWPSSGGVTAPGHDFVDFTSGAGSWSNGHLRVKMPTSYTCSSWGSTYTYNGMSTTTNAHWFWWKMMTTANGTTNCNYAGSGSDYMRADTCVNANFNVISSAGISQNTTYTNFGVGYASCTTSYGASVGWQASNKPGANCGITAWREPDGSPPKFDWTAPTAPTVTLTPGTHAYVSGTTLYVDGTVASSFTSAASGSTDSGGSGLNGYSQALTGTTSAWSPITSAAASQAFSWTTALTDGQTTTLTVNSKDVAGNTSTGVTRTLIADKVAPTVSFAAPGAGVTMIATTAYSSTITVADARSGVATWSLTRAYTTATAGTCGTSWTADGTIASGAAAVTNQSNPQTLVAGRCYRWTLSATDHVNLATNLTSGSVLVDTTQPVVTFTAPTTGATIIQTATTYTVTWTEQIGASGAASRSLQRQRGTIVTQGTCAGVTWTNDGTAVTTASPVAASGLLAGSCYRWTETLTSGAGLQGVATSGSVLVNAAAPTSDFTTPNEGTDAAQSSTAYSVAWTESGAVASRSLQRQRGTVITIGTCAGVTWANDGTAVTTASPVAISGLANAFCYRWTQTLTDAGNNSSTQTSGSVSIDTTPPTASFVAPASPTNATTLPYSLSFSESVTGLAAGDFAISGTATGWTVGAPTGSGAGPYTITLTGGGAGTVILTLNANSVVDTAGNTGPASATTAATVTVDRTAPIGAFVNPLSGTSTETGSGATVSWTETDAGSGIASRSLQRQVAAASDALACDAASYSNDGGPTTGPSPLNASGLLTGFCYRWTLALVDLAGNTSSVTSGMLFGIANPDLAPAATGHATSLTPIVGLDLGWNVVAGHPGASTQLTATVSYGVDTLSTSTSLAAKNVASGTATIKDASVVLQTRATGGSVWSPYASFQQTASGWTPLVPAPTGGQVRTLSVLALRNASTGVVYPLSLTPFAGSTIQSGSTASWQTTGVLGLNASQLTALLNTSQISGIREVIHLELTTAAHPAGQYFDVAIDMTSAVQATDPGITGVSVALSPPTGNPVTFDSSTTPALAHLAIGATPIPVSTNYAIPGSTTKLNGETDGAYITRLRSYGPLTARASATGTSGGTPLQAAQSSTLGMNVPVLGATVTGSSSAVGGHPLVETILVQGSGSSASQSIALTGTALGGTVTPTTSIAPALQPGSTAQGTVTYAVPTTFAEGATSNQVSLTWADEVGDPYGPISVTPSVWITNGAIGAPTIALASISNGSALFATEPITATATDDVSVTGVDLLVDGQVVASLGSGPYLFSWNTGAALNGPRTVQVRAHDGTGNLATSAPRPVTVNNALTSADRVHVDTASGQLSTDQAALNSVYAVIDQTQLPSRYQSSTPVVGSDLIAAALAGWGDLSTPTQQTIMTYLQTNQNKTKSAPPSTQAEYNQRIGAGWIQSCYNNWPADLPCIDNTGDFSIAYSVDPTSPNKVQDLSDTLGTALLGQDPQPCSPPPANNHCNGIPDFIDKLEAGLSQARAFYTQLGYRQPSTTQEVSVADTTGNCYSEVTIIRTMRISPFCGAFPYYMARHEYFHAVQHVYFEDSNLINGGGLFLTGFWWNEATADWAAEQATKSAFPHQQDAAPNASAWAAMVPGFLGNPSAALDLTRYGVIEPHEYGALLLADFLQERFPITCDSGGGPACANAFVARENLSPDPSIIREIWDQIALNGTAIVSIGNVLAEPSHSTTYSDALSQFWRAAYLLDASLPDGRVRGTFRNSSTALWRSSLQDVEVDGSPKRAAHASVDLTITPVAHASATFGPGGAAFVEFKVPAHVGAVQFTLNASEIGVVNGQQAPVAATVTVIAMAFSSYPTPCVADFPFQFGPLGGDGMTHATNRLVVPDACTLVTLELVHGAPTFQGPSITVTIDASQALVFDPFERPDMTGWGRAPSGWAWSTTNPGTSAITAGTGVLKSPNGVSEEDLQVATDITSITAIGQFTSCDASSEQLWLWNGDPIIAILDTGEVVARSPDGSMAPLTTIDPCKPWYIRISRQPIQGGFATAYTVWQALEPDLGPQLLTNTTGASTSLMSLFNLYGANEAHGVRFDLFDVVYLPSG